MLTGTMYCSIELNMHEYITMYVSAFIRNTPRDKTTAGWTQCQSLLDNQLPVKCISVVSSLEILNQLISCVNL